MDAVHTPLAISRRVCLLLLALAGVVSVAELTCTIYNCLRLCRGEAMLPHVQQRCKNVCHLMRELYTGQLQRGHCCRG